MTNALRNHIAPRRAHALSLWPSVAASILASLVLALGAGLPESPVVVAVFPPWWDAGSAFSAAASAGQPLSTGRLPTIVAVRGDPHRIAARLHDAGAVFVLTAGFFAWCGRAEDPKA